MPMPMLIPIGVIMLSGAIGGIINALVSDNGFIKPSEETAGEVTIIRPGFAGNILLGAVAAFISWGLYGAFANTVLFGTAYRNRNGRYHSHHLFHCRRPFGWHRRSPLADQ